MIITVVLADDHRMFREALRVPLDAEPDIRVIGEAATAAETLALLQDASPDVLVLDIRLPDGNGIDVARKALKLCPSMRVVALSGYADPLYVAEMLKAGALGYVVKSACAEDLVTAIRAAANGRTYLSEDASQAMVAKLHADGELGSAPPTVLGKREREVLALLADGKRAADIAARLGISVATADAHRRNIKKKLGLYTTAELARYAVREGLIQ